jgi:hypothetical protein
VQLGITSANSSAYSQLPAVRTSHEIGVAPPKLDLTIKRKLNIKPLNATGLNANQAARNCLRVVGEKIPIPGVKFEKRPQLLKNPTAMLEFNDETELMQRSFVVS